MVGKNQIRFLKSLGLKKNRVKYNKIIVEGTKTIKEFIDSKYKYAFNYKIGYEWKYMSLYNVPNTNVALLFNMYSKEHILSPDFLFSFIILQSFPV